LIISELTPQGAQTALVTGLEPSGKLFGRPSFRKTITDESPQFLIVFEDGFTPPAIKASAPSCLIPPHPQVTLNWKWYEFPSY
jgi:hypothetical protein